MTHLLICKQEDGAVLEEMLRAQPQEASTLFIDMDSFFASVEQQYNPRLRGRPVGVCPCLGDGCIVVAASIEAKRLGIKLGTSLREARRRCPEIVLIADSPVSYRQVHSQIMGILERTPCAVQPKSIDEAWLKLPSYLVGSEPARDLALWIRETIRREVGRYIGCSIGIAPNIWLAKMGASYDKPRGLVEIRLNQLAEFYRSLQLTDLNGISWRLARQCYRLGLNNPLELYRAPYGLLRSAWGVNGAKWYLRLRGFEVDMMASKPQQSISHQTTLMPGPAETQEDLSAVLAKMSYKLGTRLRRNGLRACGVGLYLGFADHTGWNRSYHTNQAFDSNYWILHYSKQLLGHVRDYQPVKRVAVVLYDLRSEYQAVMPLFPQAERLTSVSEAIDEINSRFGPYTIAPASTLGRRIFPDRIGFGNSRS